jgi:hypothetical protein
MFSISTITDSALQVKIFQSAIDQVPPRVVDFRNKQKGNTIPALLHVCRSSRYEALKVYTLHSFYTCFANPQQIDVFIDPKRDIVYLNHYGHKGWYDSWKLKGFTLDLVTKRSYPSLVAEEEAIRIYGLHFKDVQRLAIHEQAVEEYCQWTSSFRWKYLQHWFEKLCPNLKELSYIADGDIYTNTHETYVSSWRPEDSLTTTIMQLYGRDEMHGSLPFKLILLRPIPMICDNLVTRILKQSILQWAKGLEPLKIWNFNSSGVLNESTCSSNQGFSLS